MSEIKTFNPDRSSDDDINVCDECMSCGGETVSMEYCCNAGCDTYLCNLCYICTPSGDIICRGCYGNCLCCDEIINLSDIEGVTDVACNTCRNEGTYCSKCTDKYHIYSCNLGICHECTQKCASCLEVVCCKGIFHNTEMCEMCVLFHFREGREYMMRDLLSRVFCLDIENLIISFMG